MAIILIIDWWTDRLQICLFGIPYGNLRLFLFQDDTLNHKSLQLLVRMKSLIIFLVVLFVVCQLVVYTNGKKSKNKSSKQQKVLKEITSGIDKCIKNIDEKEKVKFNKCLIALG